MFKIYNICVYSCRCVVADGALVLPGCDLGEGSLVGVKSVIQAFSHLDPGAVWAGSPALCLDPGLTADDSENARGTLAGTMMSRKATSTRWQRSQKELALRPKSMVLSSRGLVAMESARLSEGMSGLIAIEEEDDFETDARGNLSMFRQRVSRVIKGPVSGRSRTNTFRRGGSTAFSQATMIVEELQEVKQGGLDYARMALIVPCVLVPAWIAAALVVPLYILRSGVAFKLIPVAATTFGKNIKYIFDF